MDINTLEAGIVLGSLEQRATDAARRAANIAEYSPYADLRDAMRKAMDAMRDIESLPADVRERLEGGTQ